MAKSTNKSGLLLKLTTNLSTNDSNFFGRHFNLRTVKANSHAFSPLVAGKLLDASADFLQFIISELNYSYEILIQRLAKATNKSEAPLDLSTNLSIKDSNFFGRQFTSPTGKAYMHTLISTVSIIQLEPSAELYLLIICEPNHDNEASIQRLAKSTNKSGAVLD